MGGDSVGIRKEGKNSRINSSLDIGIVLKNLKERLSDQQVEILIGIVLSEPSAGFGW